MDINIKTLGTTEPSSSITSDNVRINDIVCFVNRVSSHNEIHTVVNSM